MTTSSKLSVVNIEFHEPSGPKGTTTTTTTTTASSSSPSSIFLGGNNVKSLLMTTKGNRPNSATKSNHRYGGFHNNNSNNNNKQDENKNLTVTASSTFRDHRTSTTSIVPSKAPIPTTTRPSTMKKTTAVATTTTTTTTTTGFKKEAMAENDRKERMAKRKRRKQLAAAVAVHWIRFTRIRCWQRAWRQRYLRSHWTVWKQVLVASQFSRHIAASRTFRWWKLECHKGKESMHRPSAMALIQRKHSVRLLKYRFHMWMQNALNCKDERHKDGLAQRTYFFTMAPKVWKCLCLWRSRAAAASMLAKKKYLQCSERLLRLLWTKWKKLACKSRLLYAAASKVWFGREKRLMKAAFGRCVKKTRSSRLKGMVTKKHNRRRMLLMYRHWVQYVGRIQWLNRKINQAIINMEQQFKQQMFDRWNRAIQCIFHERILSVGDRIAAAHSHRIRDVFFSLWVQVVDQRHELIHRSRVLQHHMATLRLTQGLDAFIHGCFLSANTRKSSRKASQFLRFHRIRWAFGVWTKMVDQCQQCSSIHLRFEHSCNQVLLRKYFSLAWWKHTRQLHSVTKFSRNLAVRGRRRTLARTIQQWQLGTQDRSLQIVLSRKAAAMRRKHLQMEGCLAFKHLVHFHHYLRAKTVEADAVRSMALCKMGWFGFRTHTLMSRELQAAANHLELKHLCLVAIANWSQLVLAIGRARTTAEKMHPLKILKFGWKGWLAGLKAVQCRRDNNRKMLQIVRERRLLCVQRAHLVAWGNVLFNRSQKRLLVLRMQRKVFFRFQMLHFHALVSTVVAHRRARMLGTKNTLKHCERLLRLVIGQWNIRTLLGIRKRENEEICRDHNHRRALLRGWNPFVLLTMKMKHKKQEEMNAAMEFKRNVLRCACSLMLQHTSAIGTQQNKFSIITRQNITRRVHALVKKIAFRWLNKARKSLLHRRNRVGVTTMLSSKTFTRFGSELQAIQQKNIIRVEDKAHFDKRQQPRIPAFLFKEEEEEIAKKKMQVEQWIAASPKQEVQIQQQPLQPQRKSPRLMLMPLPSPKRNNNNTTSNLSPSSSSSTTNTSISSNGYHTPPTVMKTRKHPQELVDHLSTIEEQLLALKNVKKEWELSKKKLLAIEVSLDELRGGDAFDEDAIEERQELLHFQQVMQSRCNKLEMTWKSSLPLVQQLMSVMVVDTKKSISTQRN